MKTITATEFKAKCLRVIGQMGKDREPITITKRGRPVAILSPLPQAHETPSIVGAIPGSVLAYSEPYEPVANPSDWTASH